MMDIKSEAFLAYVHPALSKVIRAASQHTPFEVVYGIRTPEAEAAAVASGHSQTLHSRHLPNAQGLACAVDVAHLLGAQLDWAPGHEAQIYGAIATEILIAAHTLGVHIQWGGSWNETPIPEAPTTSNPRPFHDWGHFQLPWSIYP